ncbi:MAG: AMP-binding protein [Janthinobacterium lividum]
MEAAGYSQASRTDIGKFVPVRASLSQGAIFRVVASLVAAERANIGSGHAWDSAGWSPATSVGPDDLGLDSLELLAASDVVSRFFRLHETGDENRLLSEGTLGNWSRIVSDSLLEKRDGFTFATSGTTGLPKLRRQPMDTLYDEALFWSEQLAGRQRVVQTVAAHHIYGFLFTVLLPDITGWPVIDARMMHPGTLHEVLRPTDLLVGFPTGLAAMLRTVVDLPAGLGVVSATSGLPANTHKALQSCGAGEVIDIYGSSETAGVAARRDPDSPFELLPRWQRGLAEGSIAETTSGAVFALPDRVTWEGERLLRPAERVDGAVQVAGVNVFPEQVAERLRRHPMVAECMVSLDTALPEPRLRAFIVPVAGSDAETVIAICDRWARRNLTAPERPVSFEAKASLP